MRKERIIEILKMMGYQVVEHPSSMFIRVFLPLKSGKTLHYTAWLWETEMDGVVEHIVSEFNSTISRDF